LRLQLTMDKPIIRLRPHHALCLRHYVGKGYDESFIANMDEIHRRLSSGEREMVQIIMHRDSLCGACPHEKDAACEEEDRVQRLDKAVASACSLRSGLWISWQELCEIIDRHLLDTPAWQELCADCQWYSLCAKVHN